MKHLLLVIGSLTLAVAASAQVGVGTTTPTSTMDVRGSISASYRAFTNTTAITIADHAVVFTGTAATTATLPDATTCTGRIYTIKNASTAATTPVLTIATTSSQTIDGATTWVLDEPKEVIAVISNGANWEIHTQNVPVAKTATTGGAWNEGGNKATGTKAIGTTTAYDLPFITNGTEKMRITSAGSVGIGTNAPSSSYALSVVSAANPLFVTGLQAGTATDSFLTIVSGVVKKIPASALPTGTSTSTNAWGLTGNNNTLASNYFLGTTNTDPLILKVNSQLSGRIDLVNTFIGYQAGYNNGIAANKNTGIGFHALTAATTGGNNTAVGYNTLPSVSTGTNNVGIGYNIDGTSALIYTLGIGSDVYISGNYSTAIGASAQAASNNALAIGHSAYTDHPFAIAIGENAKAQAEDGISLGYGTYVDHQYATAIGYSAQVQGLDAMAIGHGAYSNASYGIAVGSNAKAQGTNAVVLGQNAYSGSANGIAIGGSTAGTQANAIDAIAIGDVAYAGGQASVAIGTGAHANAQNSVAIGNNAITGQANAILLGDNTNSAVRVGIGTAAPDNKLEINSGIAGASGLRLKELPAGAVLFMSSIADVAQNNNNFYFDATNYRLGVAAGTTPNSTLQVGGSVSFPVVTKTATYTASTSDYTILCNSAGTMTINLPAVLGTAGRTYVIKKISTSSFLGSNTVTIDASGSELIDGSLTQTLNNQYSSITVQSDGTAWYITSKI